MGGLLAYIKDNINKHFTLQNGYEILSKTFSKVEKKYIDSLAVPNIDDMVDYIYSLSSMTSLNSVPKELSKNNFSYCLSFSPIAPLKNQLHSPLCA